jgi:hypothetical protein
MPGFYWQAPIRARFNASVGRPAVNTETRQREWKKCYLCLFTLCYPCGQRLTRWSLTFFPREPVEPHVPVQSVKLHWASQWPHQILVNLTL